jgi:hypothetical protein
MINNGYEKFFHAAFLATILQISGCSENVREAPASIITEHTTHVATPNKQGLTWFAPELHKSQYRTLFFGYDTLDYRLAAPEAPDSNSFRLIIKANYGGNIRHYDFAKGADEASHAINLLQHDTERCQLFNSMISSCLYQDRFSLTLSRSDLEQARVSGLQLLLTSKSQSYEHIDVPATYIQGFLKAVEGIASKPVN